MSMNMRDYSILHLDTNLSTGTRLFYISQSQQSHRPLTCHSRVFGSPITCTFKQMDKTFIAVLHFTVTVESSVAVLHFTVTVEFSVAVLHFSHSRVLGGCSTFHSHSRVFGGCSTFHSHSRVFGGCSTFQSQQILRWLFYYISVTVESSVAVLHFSHSSLRWLFYISQSQQSSVAVLHFTVTVESSVAVLHFSHSSLRPLTCHSRVFGP